MPGDIIAQKSFHLVKLFILKSYLAHTYINEQVNLIYVRQRIKSIPLHQGRIYYIQRYTHTHTQSNIYGHISEYTAYD